jgi:hypothetical protein
VFLGDNLVSWSAKRQTVVSCSSAEAEYRTVANGVAKATWLRQLLHELQTLPSRCTLVYCDNISAVYLSTNPVQHQRTKHVEIDLHFIREKIAIGQVRILHVPTTSQFADIFTKGLLSSMFNEFWSSLNICSGLVVTAGVLKNCNNILVIGVVGPPLMAKSSGATVLGFPPRRRHPLGLPTLIYYILHDSIDRTLFTHGTTLQDEMGGRYSIIHCH